MRLSALVILFLSLGATSAQAQLFYSPAPSAEGIPLLGGFALLLTSLGLFTVAIVKGGLWHGRFNSLAGLCLVVAVASGVSGTRVISQAQADGGGSGGGGMSIIGFIDSPTGGLVAISSSALNVFENTSGERQRIEDIVLPEECPDTNSGVIDGTTRCNVGDIVPTGVDGMCYTDCRPLAQ
ncbi:MAG: hypothetical protein AAGI88_00095 [Pseudomonadota bacterium]